MKDKTDLVSVIVTSYNHAEYLDERMESLLKQTYPNLEIIVVDDCSSDKSLEVLEKYKKYKHINIIALKQNGGYANASNLGVSLSNGEYIMFAECDDYNEPSHIERLYKKIVVDSSIGVAYCKSHMVDSKGTIFGDDFCYRESRFRRLYSRDALIPQQEMRRFFLFSCVVPNMSAALIRKSVFKLVDGLSSKYRACADWDFWCRISAHCDFYYVASPLNFFRTHVTSVRNTSGIQTPLIEIIQLLYTAFAKTELNLREQIRFRINIGYIWASYITGSPLNWLRSFSTIYRNSLQYDKLSLLYLFLGILKKILAVSNRLLRK